MNQINLPAVTADTAPILGQLSAALSIPRDVLASDEEIALAWQGLPRLINRIPVADRNELHMRMCVAVAAGLFDAAINYAWNSSIIKLRQKVREFGINVIPQLLGRPFTEDTLDDLKDSELLDLCLKLNLLPQDSHLLLDQCRELRNKFSAAHPPLGTLDDSEFLNFLNRCTKYVLADADLPRGVDMTGFIASIKSSLFLEDQIAEWTQRIHNTHDAQRELIATSLHGIYCDPNSTQDTRANALGLAENIHDGLSQTALGELVNRHSDYVAAGDNDRRAASRTFFEKLGRSSLLNDSERHAIFSSACKLLMQTHLGMNNFYNEPPFAERLHQLALQTAVPSSCQEEFVEVVGCCAVGNGYGVCRAAVPHYNAMIQNFSPNEIAIFFALSKGNSRLGMRISQIESCRRRFFQTVRLLDPQAIPVRVQSLYSQVIAAST
jgi:hypothetical protein